MWRTYLLLLLVLGTHANAQFVAPIAQGDLEVRVEIKAAGLAGLVAGDFQISPTEIVPDGSGRLFVATLGGVIRTYSDATGLLPSPFLNQLQTGTTPASNGEWGMTGLVFHPDYLQTGARGYGKFYTITTEPAGANGGDVDFSVPIDHQDVIKEWTAADPLANAFSGSVREVMRVGQPGQPHNVFDLAFDDDGYLFISSGDGGFSTAAQSQSLGSIHGKVLRIDPLAPPVSDPSRGVISANGNYRVPTDNPFFNQPGALGEVWAYGLRSPFRMNVDRATGDLWIGDVGAGQREEVNLVEPGSNLGWPFFEGTRQLASNPPADAVPPVFEYLHNEGLSVIGGFVYRGAAMPWLQGKYVFADLGEGLPNARLLYGDPATGEVFDFQIDPTSDAFLGRLGPEAGTELPLPERIISIGEDEHGELYLAAVGIDPRQGGGIDGMIVKVLPPRLPGDFNDDGRVDIADYTTWRDGLGSDYTPADYLTWVDNFGASNAAGGLAPDAIPEPVACFLLLVACVGGSTRR